MDVSAPNLICILNVCNDNHQLDTSQANMTKICYHYEVSISLRIKAILRINAYGVIRYIRNHNEYLPEVWQAIKK